MKIDYLVIFFNDDGLPYRARIGSDLRQVKSYILEEEEASYEVLRWDGNEGSALNEQETQIVEEWNFHQ